MALQEKQKFIRLKSLKNSSSKPDAVQLDQITRYTRRKFTTDELYIGEVFLAHNAIDRDRERFGVEVLNRFLVTIVGKTMLFDHAKYDLKNSAVGKFFAAIIETMTVDQAAELLGETLELPPGETQVKILIPSFYIPVEGVDKQVITKIDAGIFDFASIGFRAEALVPVTDASGNRLYSEYRGAGLATEATEASLVYLGAQNGMRVKMYKPSLDMESNTQFLGKREGEKTMDPTLAKLLEKLSQTFDKNFTMENTVDHIKSLVAAAEAKTKDLEEKIKSVKPLEDRIKELEPLIEKVKTLEPIAADGKAYRDTLINDYVAQKAKLGEVAETPEAQKTLREVVKGYPIDFLKTEVEHLQKRVEKTFPSEGQLNGDMRRDKSEHGKDDSNKSFLEPD